MLTLYLTLALVVVLGLAIALLAFHLSTRYSESGKLINEIPGPPALPLIGNLLTLNASPVVLWDLFIKHVHELYYPIFRVWFVRSAGVVLGHPDDYKAMLSCKKNINKSHLGYSNFKFMGEDGLIVSGGDKWRTRRKMLNPAFNANLLRNYMQVANENTVHFIENWKAEGKEHVVDLMMTYTKLSFWIICEATLGVPIRNHSVDEERVKKAFHDLCQVTFYRAVRPYISDWMMKYLEAGRKQREALTVTRELIYKIINERRDYHKENDYRDLESLNDDTELFEDDELSDVTSKKRLAVLDLLLAAERSGQIDESGIREEVGIMVAAGHETINVSMGFTTMLLAENKKIQDSARAEVLAAMARCGGRLTIDEIQKLDCLERIIKESLRLFTPACIIARHTTDELQLDKYKVPIGTEMIMNLFCVHRDPHFWPEPDKFDPDRFTSANSKDRHPYSFIPFSAGPRGCIGQKFAVMEMKIILAHMLANFYFEPIDYAKDLTFEFFITLKPTREIHAKLIAIERK